MSNLGPLKNAGKVLTYKYILGAIWGPNNAAQSHNVRVHVEELRRKVEAEVSVFSLFITEAGVGYRLRVLK